MSSVSSELPLRTPKPIGIARPSQRAQKRILDLVCASLLLAIFAFPMLIIAIAIKLDSPGPVLFRQPRRGYRGSEFTILKFRSMYVGTGDSQHREAFAQWFRGTKESGNQVYKLCQDSRVTWVGNIIRRTNLDELPQLFNVIRKDMSIVGPRPAIEYECAHYSLRHMDRFSVWPGITGLWQVSGWHHTSFEEMIDLDLRYIDQWSIISDLKIMLKTVPIVLLARGR